MFVVILESNHFSCYDIADILRGYKYFVETRVGRRLSLAGDDSDRLAFQVYLQV